VASPSSLATAVCTMLAGIFVKVHHVLVIGWFAGVLAACRTEVSNGLLTAKPPAKDEG